MRVLLTSVLVLAVGACVVGPVLGQVVDPPIGLPPDPEVDPYSAPLHTLDDPALDVLHLDGVVSVVDEGDWRVRLTATVVALRDDLDAIQFPVLRPEIGWVRFVRDTTGTTPDPDLLRVGPGAPDSLTGAVPILFRTVAGDTLAIDVEYIARVGRSLRTSGGDACCTWTWTPRTGGEPWLPFRGDMTDAFTATFRFEGMQVVAGGSRPLASDSTTAPSPTATTIEYAEPVTSDQVIVVAGDLEPVHTGGPFVYHVPKGLVDGVAAFARTFESAFAHAESLTGVQAVTDTVQVVFADVGERGEDVGYGLAVADLTRLDVAPADLAPSVLAARFWAGGVLRPAAWTDLWLTEGLAHWLAVDHVRATRGEGEAWRELVALRHEYLDEATVYRRPLVWDRWHGAADLADAHARGRGAWFLRQVEGLVGRDAFLESVRGLLKSAPDAGLYTEDLREALESTSERRLADLFDAWVHGAGHPRLSLSTRFDPVDEQLAVSIVQHQDGEYVPRAFPLETRLDWRSLAGDGSFEIEIVETESQARIAMPLDPRFVAFDPDGWLLVDLEYAMDLSSATAAIRYAPLAARHRAAEAMTGLQDDPALPLALRLAAEREPESVVREALLRAARGLGATSSLESLLRAGYDDPDPTVRAAALELGASFFARPDVAQFVADAAGADSVQSVQATAVRVLSAMAADDAEYYARAALITPSRGDIIRAAGFSVLAEMGVGDLEDEVITHSAPDLPVTRILAALSAADHLQPSTRLARRIDELLAHDHYRVRLAAARHAGRLAERETLERLAATERDREVRAALARGLASRADAG